MTDGRMTSRILGCTANLMIAAVLIMGFSACSSDDDEKTTATEDQTLGRTLPMAFDDLTFFQGTIAGQDDAQEPVFYYGEALDSEDPQHLFVGVDNWQEAETMFRLWMAPDVVVTTEADGALSARLTDSQNRQQGTVRLDHGTTDDHIAELTLSDDIEMKLFRQITFLDNRAWPVKPQGLLMATQKRYCKFDIVRDIRMKDINSDLHEEDRKLDFVCIQGSGNGVKPIFCGISHGTYLNPNYNKYNKIIRDSWYTPGEATSPTAYTIQQILRKDWDAFAQVFAEEANGGPLTTGTDYWFNESHYTFIWVYNGVISYYSGYTYGEDEHEWKHFLFRLYGFNDSQVYDGASL